MADAPRLRSGRYYTEAELAAAAAAARVRHKLTQTALAKLIGVTPNAVLMALDFEKYPNRGQSVRRKILRQLEGREFSGPVYRDVTGLDADAPD